MPMSPRLLRPRASGLVLPTDADARAYVLAVNTADGQPLEPLVVQAIDAFVIGCKADGIWSSIKASCILMGARTLSGALTPLVGSAPTNVNNNFVSGDYNRKTGLVGDGATKYLSTGRANNADPQNNQSMGVWVSAIGGGTNDAIIGSGTGTTIGASHIVIQKAPATPTERVLFRSRAVSADANNFNFISVTPTTGMHGISRNSSSGFSYLASGVSGSPSLSSNTPDSGTINVFARGVESLFPATHRLAYYWVGESLSLSSLNSRVSTLFNAIGAAIP